MCARRESRQPIRILELPLPEPPPEGAEWIDAYRRWAPDIAVAPRQQIALDRDKVRAAIRTLPAEYVRYMLAVELLPPATKSAFVFSDNESGRVTTIPGYPIRQIIQRIDEVFGC